MVHEVEIVMVSERDDQEEDRDGQSDEEEEFPPISTCTEPGWDSLEVTKTKIESWLQHQLFFSFNAPCIVCHRGLFFPD